LRNNENIEETYLPEKSFEVLCLRSRLPYAARLQVWSIVENGRRLLIEQNMNVEIIQVILLDWCVKGKVGADVLSFNRIETRCVMICG